MIGNLVLRGIVIGILAGLLGFGWAKTFGEPAVNIAIAFESAQDEAKQAAAVAAHQPVPPDDPVIFSRTVQGGVGLLTGVVAIGAGIGGLFAILFAFANGRMGNLAPGPTSLLLALLGLVSVYVVPGLKYPANPPSIGQPDTIKFRTGVYFLMMAISVSSTIGALILRTRTVRAFGTWSGSLLAAGAYLVVIAAAMVILPGINEVPATFPAATLWNFRMASLGLQTVLWMSIGVMFGYVGAWTLAGAQRSSAYPQ